jgi:hypothetical protein
MDVMAEGQEIDSRFTLGQRMEITSTQRRGDPFGASPLRGEASTK